MCSCRHEKSPFVIPRCRQTPDRVPLLLPPPPIAPSLPTPSHHNRWDRLCCTQCQRCVCVQVSRAWVKVVVVWEGQGVPLTNSPSLSSPAPWRMTAAVWSSDDDHGVYTTGIGIQFSIQWYYCCVQRVSLCHRADKHIDCFRSSLGPRDRHRTNGKYLL